MTPPKFNQNLTIKNPAAEKFSCFPTTWEEGPTDLADYSDEEEDDSLANEDILSESGEEEVNFEAHSELKNEEEKGDPTFTSIFCISEKKNPAYAEFAAW
jgi:hypothetical protein